MLNRKIDTAIWPFIIVKYTAIISADNIRSLSRWQIKRIFRKEKPHVKEIYLHNILNRWFKRNKEDNRIFFDIFKKLIKKTGIKLNSVEQHNLLRMEERIFALERTLKKLDVSEKLLKHEVVYAKFSKAFLYLSDGHLEPIIDGPLLITNQRFIIQGVNSYKFELNHLEWYSPETYGFEFKYNKDVHVIRIHDQATLNNTINTIFKRRVKNVLEKRKNNKS